MSLQGWMIVDSFINHVAGQGGTTGGASFDPRLDSTASTKGIMLG